MNEQKPLIPLEIAAQLPHDKALQLRFASCKTEDDIRLLVSEISLQHKLKAFKTQDEKTLVMLNKCVKLSGIEDEVLIQGESGTGKELIARILHGNRKGEFVPVNSTAVTESLFESEVFGHTRGAFTGASESRSGLISHANEGTLFFDEIGDMPLNLQPKLLRVLQTRKFRLVGSNAEQPVKCRFIFATHMNLEELVKAKLFRLDLYYRICVFSLNIIPLRKRMSDLDLIVADEECRKQIIASGFTFPGNVREVEAYMKRWKLFGSIDSL